MPVRRGRLLAVLRDLSAVAPLDTDMYVPGLADLATTSTRPRRSDTEARRQASRRITDAARNRHEADRPPEP